MLFLLLVIFVVFVFEYINGFHDAANAIATVVSTRVLSPRLAIILAATFNLFGALSGEAVALGDATMVHKVPSQRSIRVW